MIDLALYDRLTTWSAQDPGRRTLLENVDRPEALEKIAAALELGDAFDVEALRQAALETVRIQRNEPAPAPAFGGALHGVAALRAKLAPRKPFFTHPAEGPAPNLTPPLEAEVRRAIAELASLGPGEKLSDRATRVLLLDTVYTTRAALSGCVDPAHRDPFGAKAVAGSCGFGQAVSAYHLYDLGIPEHEVPLHQSAFIVHGAFNHAFIVAKMPNGKAYLIDATYRQFFDARYTKTDQIGEPGALMRRNPAFKRIAWQLLRDGFIELSDDVARAYLFGLTQGRKADAKADDLMEPTEHRGLDLSRERVENIVRRYRQVRS